MCYIYRRLESRHVKGKQNRRMRERRRQKKNKTKKEKLVCRECSNCACMRVYVYTCVRVNVRVYVFVCALAYDVIRSRDDKLEAKIFLHDEHSSVGVRDRRGGTRVSGWLVSAGRTVLRRMNDESLRRSRDRSKFEILGVTGTASPSSRAIPLLPRRNFKLSIFREHDR